jgi:hypothetical protein
MTNTTLPTKITVGKTTYSIRRGAPSGCLGNVDYDKQVISIALRDGLGNTLDPEEVRDTFWHEITHAVLHDMNHPLRDDEKFVIKFANRLSCAIDSAEF